eukprot:452396_1
MSYKVTKYIVLTSKSGRICIIIILIWTIISLKLIYNDENHNLFDVWNSNITANQAIQIAQHINYNNWEWDDIPSRYTNQFCSKPITIRNIGIYDVFKRKYGDLLFSNRSHGGLWSDRNIANYFYNKPVNIAYGCSVSSYYCIGEPQSIPCCTKIAFDIWYELHKYFIRYNVTFYTLTWGSLLFSIRDGYHLPFEKDIDLSNIMPAANGKKALRKFIQDYNMSTGKNKQHIIDIGTFYIRHHKKYGYPSLNKYFCFINHDYI